MNAKVYCNKCGYHTDNCACSVMFPASPVQGAASAPTDDFANLIEQHTGITAARAPGEYAELAALCAALAERAQAAQPIRQSLGLMTVAGAEPREWYFDCDGHYIDVARDGQGNYSIYFKDRATDKEAWLDTATPAPEQEAAPQTDDEVTLRGIAAHALFEAKREGVRPEYRLVMLRQRAHEAAGRFAEVQECAAIRFNLEQIADTNRSDQEGGGA